MPKVLTRIAAGYPGAGTWHLGLHRPDNWCVMGPGAGFTTTGATVYKGTSFRLVSATKALAGAA